MYPPLHLRPSASRIRISEGFPVHTFGAHLRTRLSQYDPFSAWLSSSVTDSERRALKRRALKRPNLSSDLDRLRNSGQLSGTAPEDHTRAGILWLRRIMVCHFCFRKHIHYVILYMELGTTVLPALRATTQRVRTAMDTRAASPFSVGTYKAMNIKPQGFEEP
ncbi:hypothetical protein CALCODRAFT_222886 [Calocera cornea HHB12733]|uniref:Uncharacterized protein n=1 Tax=Calocera cornea HHB12733 TaxID=1353952 RepID=A0A165H5C5_9BASI|nr:hypothetical protein CALCODRAFT_222886 [Calocera cornea HHB12733]